MGRMKKFPPPVAFCFVFMLLITVMPLVSESQSRAPPMPARPLCLSQFALANHACSFLPYNPNPFEPTPPSEEPDDSNQNGNVGVLHVESDQNGNDHHHGNGGNHRHHAHRHRHRQRPTHHYQETPVEHECCRWLKSVDDQCVCDVLVHLPVFLARPWHRFQLVVDETCNITYSCSGRVI